MCDKGEKNAYPDGSRTSSHCRHSPRTLAAHQRVLPLSRDFSHGSLVKSRARAYIYTYAYIPYTRHIRACVASSSACKPPSRHHCGYLLGTPLPCVAKRAVCGAAFFPCTRAPCFSFASRARVDTVAEARVRRVQEERALTALSILRYSYISVCV